MIKRVLALVMVLGLAAITEAGLGYAEARPFARTAAVYGAVIRRLVEDQATGQPVTVVYVINGAVEGAADPMSSSAAPAQPFSRMLKLRLRRGLRGQVRLRFVDDRAAVVAGKPPGTVINGGVLVTLAPIRGIGSQVEVPTSLWVSGLNGRWLTYVVASARHGWRVVGTTGQMAIS